MTVLAPADAVEVAACMRVANDLPGPVYVRMTRDPEPVIFPADYQFELGKAVTARAGTDVALISTGAQTPRCLEAADQLAADGVSALVLHLPTIKPLDEDAIVAAAEATGKVVTAEDHTVIGGLGGAVAEVLGEKRPTPMKRIGIRDTFGESADNDDLLAKYGLTSSHVADAARVLMG